MSDIKGKAKQEQQDDDPLFDDVEFEKILNQEASLLSRESEVTNSPLSLSILSWSKQSYRYYEYSHASNWTHMKS